MKSTIQRSIALLVGMLVSSPVVLIQQAVAQDDTRDVEEVITTGTRSEERSSSESPAPIDVITGDEFTNQADTDLGHLIGCTENTTDPADLVNDNVDRDFHSRLIERDARTDND